MILTPNELVLTFGGLRVCVQFGENRRRNATVRVSTDGHTRTHGQTQNDFVICPMLYAIVMGQMITESRRNNRDLSKQPSNINKKVSFIKKKRILYRSYSDKRGDENRLQLAVPEKLRQ